MARDVPRGDVPTLILAVLREQPAHGYAIARAIEHLSDDVLQLREGSLYPALRVLEEAGHIIGAWEKPVQGPARKVYALTKSGEEQLEDRAQLWQRYANAIQTILGQKGSAHA